MEPDLRNILSKFDKALSRENKHYKSQTRFLTFRVERQQMGEKWAHIYLEPV
jgi:hypothetical protein